MRAIEKKPVGYNYVTCEYRLTIDHITYIWTVRTGENEDEALAFFADDLLTMGVTAPGYDD